VEGGLVIPINSTLLLSGVTEGSTEGYGATLSGIKITTSGHWAGLRYQAGNPWLWLYPRDPLYTTQSAVTPGMFIAGDLDDIQTWSTTTGAGELNTSGRNQFHIGMVSPTRGPAQETRFNIRDWTAADGTSAIIASLGGQVSSQRFADDYFAFTKSHRLYMDRDADTYLQHSTANTFKFVVGGTTVLTMTSNGCTIVTAT
jgi:hypothetical protein